MLLIVLLILLIAAVATLGFFWWPSFLFLILAVPFLLLAIYDYLQKSHTILRNFPLLGHLRYFSERVRPGVQQYFVESNIDGRPFNRNDRTIVYARSKEQNDTNPFGTQEDLYQEGYEWMAHSIAAKDPHNLDHHPRVEVGGPQCTKPYKCSIYNISAMSFGSLSKAAVLALNHGAQIAKFAHNTGEGGISPYHLEPGGDLIYQVGTGYFGCRAADGNFDRAKFKETVKPKNVKMIELKLSQGAKPGHGGILPAKKVSAEIAKIRGVEQGKSVNSPPYHKAFDTPMGLIQLINEMRELADGRPVGFKLCIGRKSEFLGICKAIKESGLYPDFITIDGGEGGTGAAPLEFSDSVGMPMHEALAFAYDSLVGFGIKRHITLFAAGKIVTGFDMFRAFALGADACYAARAFMLSLGCIQARECNHNTCPTGITTQNAKLMRGLVVEDKKDRVANFHKNTLESLIELVAAAGLENPHQIKRHHIKKRFSGRDIKRYDEIFPYLSSGRLLKGGLPDEYKELMAVASAESFASA